MLALSPAKSAETLCIPLTQMCLFKQSLVDNECDLKADFKFLSLAFRVYVFNLKNQCKNPDTSCSLFPLRPATSAETFSIVFTRSSLLKQNLIDDAYALNPDFRLLDAAFS